MSYRAEIVVKRRTLSGRIEQTLYAYGDTREEAFFTINDDIKRANHGADKSSPLLIKVGKPLIRSIPSEER